MLSGGTGNGVAVAAAVAIGALAASGSAAQDSPNLQSMAILTGTCERLIVADADRSAACHGALVNLTYRNGRTSFMFSDPQAQMAISFSGTSEVRAGDVVTLTVSMITRASGSTPTVDAEPASGTCDYSNPYAGRSYVRCTGTTASGGFSGSFTTNGEPPDVVQH